MIKAYYTKHTEHVPIMKAIFELYEPEVYVEVGVDRAYTFNQLAPLVKKRAVGVDHKDRSDRIISLPTIKFMLGTSADMVKEWDGTPIDMLFIDANHHKEQVLRDFDLWTPYVVEGTGLIFLHDTCPRLLDYPKHCNDACEAAWEIRTSNKYRPYFEIMNLPGPAHGMSIVRKSKKQLAYPLLRLCSHEEHYK